MIRYLIDFDAFVTEEMQDELYRDYPDHFRSFEALADGLNAVAEYDALKQLLRESDDQQALKAFLQEHPVKSSKYLLASLRNAVQFNRLRCFQLLLPILGQCPGVNYAECRSMC